jgi:hypothetical protein
MKEDWVHSYMVLGDKTCPESRHFICPYISFELDFFAIVKESSVVVESVIKYVQNSK